MKYKLKGINDDQDVCSVCGKVNLKRVAWLVAIDNGEEVGEVFPVGMDCAGRMLGWKENKTRKQISLVADFESFIEKCNRYKTIGKEKVLDWIFRLHQYRIAHNWNKTNTDNLVVEHEVDGVIVYVKIW